MAYGALRKLMPSLSKDKKAALYEGLMATKGEPMAPAAKKKAKAKKKCKCGSVMVQKPSNDMDVA